MMARPVLGRALERVLADPAPERAVLDMAASTEKAVRAQLAAQEAAREAARQRAVQEQRLRPRGPSMGM